MPEAVTLKIDGTALRRSLLASNQEVRKASAKALNRTAFEVLASLREEAGRAFAKAGPRGKQFLSGRGSFVFDKATEESLAVTVKPNGPERNRVLAEHERGGTLLPSEDRLGLGAEYLAIPTGVRRGPSGRVPPALTPARLLARYRRQRTRRSDGARRKLKRTEADAFFLAMKEGSPAGAIRQRVGTITRSAYAIVAKAKLPKRFYWSETVELSYRAWIGRKLEEELKKIP